tara:strand:- start:2835 stop:2960 length:126 start_codon:yes stop_codon:yes gene_type:complete
MKEKMVSDVGENNGVLCFIMLTADFGETGKGKNLGNGSLLS